MRTGSGFRIVIPFLLAGAFALLAALTAAPAPASFPARVVVVPAPDFVLHVDVTQQALEITYTITFDNVGEGIARTVELRDELPEGSTYLGDPGDLVEGVWTRTYEDLGPGTYNETVAVRMPADAQDQDRVTNTVELLYAGYSGPAVTSTFTHEFAMALPRPPAPVPMWVVAAPVGAATAGVGGLLVVRARRRPKFEQVFLMHNSGMLIHHWAASASPTRDIDILSGMFVILKEFVRDSFREKAGGLSELQFGDSRMFLAEGDHSILAAVVSGTNGNGTPAQIATAIRDFERTHGPTLTNWTGNVDRLPEARRVVEDLVRGRYVRGRAA